MSRPMIKLVNASTGEEIEREMNDEEFSKWQASRAEFDLKREREENKEASRLAILDKLGLTEEEAKILLS